MVRGGATVHGGLELRFPSIGPRRSSVGVWESWRRWWGTSGHKESKQGSRREEIDGRGGGESALLELLHGRRKKRGRVRVREQLVARDKDEDGMGSSGVAQDGTAASRCSPRVERA